MSSEQIAYTLVKLLTTTAALSGCVSNTNAQSPTQTDFAGTGIEPGTTPTIQMVAGPETGGGTPQDTLNFKTSPVSTEFFSNQAALASSDLDDAYKGTDGLVARTVNELSKPGLGDPLEGSQALTIASADGTFVAHALLTPVHVLASTNEPQGLSTMRPDTKPKLALLTIEGTTGAPLYAVYGNSATDTQSPPHTFMPVAVLSEDGTQRIMRGDTINMNAGNDVAGFFMRLQLLPGVDAAEYGKAAAAAKTEQEMNEVMARFVQGISVQTPKGELHKTVPNLKTTDEKANAQNQKQLTELSKTMLGGAINFLIPTSFIQASVEQTPTQIPPTTAPTLENTPAPTDEPTTVATPQSPTPGVTQIAQVNVTATPDSTTANPVENSGITIAQLHDVSGEFDGIPVISNLGLAEDITKRAEFPFNDVVLNTEFWDADVPNTAANIFSESITRGNFVGYLEEHPGTTWEEYRELRKGSADISYTVGVSVPGETFDTKLVKIDPRTTRFNVLFKAAHSGMIIGAENKDNKSAGASVSYLYDEQNNILTIAVEYSPLDVGDNGAGTPIFSGPGGLLIANGLSGLGLDEKFQENRHKSEFEMAEARGTVAAETQTIYDLLAPIGKRPVIRIIVP